MTVQELLSVEKIVDILQNQSPQDQRITLAEMKIEASKMHLVRDFNNAVKEANTEVRRRQLGKPLADVPEPITDNAGYDITELGIYLPMQNSSLEICPYPLFVTERYQDIDDGTEKVKIVYKRDNAWREIIVPRNTIANASKIIQLADSATGINSENAKAVVRYLSDIESANRYTIPTKYATARLGWTEYGFVPFIDNITFTGAETYAQLYDKFHTKGDFNVWRELSVTCLKYPLPRIITAAAYASLLLKHIGVNGFCVHIWGESGRGKTVALMLAASVYGDADPKSGIIRNGKTTSNGIEPVLGFFNDCAVIFDELTTLSQEQITDMVYKFAQGQGKGRMTKNAGLQKSYTWNNVAILSAEKPLTDNKTMSGAINRVISLYAEGAVFGDLDMVHIANTLRENYGFGARLFIDALNTVDVQAIYKKYITEIDDRIEQKQANAAAVILTAYEIAAKHVYGIDNVMTADDLLPFLATKNEVSVSERAYENLMDWIRANYVYFDESEINQSKWGIYGQNREIVHIYYTRFIEWCDRNGYQPTAILREWRSKNLIKTRARDELKNNARVKGQLYTDMVTVLLKNCQSNFIDGLEEVDTGGELPF